MSSLTPSVGSSSAGSSIAVPPVATLEELETLALGIEGKLALWGALRHGANGDGTLGPELDGLIARARTQRELVEELRLKAAEAVAPGIAAGCEDPPAAARRRLVSLPRGLMRDACYA